MNILPFREGMRQKKNINLGILFDFNATFQRKKYKLYLADSVKNGYLGHESKSLTT